MSRVEMPVLYPYRSGESPESWTNRVLSHAREHGTNRQCTIGWHGECSDRMLGPGAEGCQCICHDPEAEVYSVEGHAEDGTATVLRVEKGEQHWPAQDGEPATMWAWWVWGLSLADAEERAVAKQSKILEEGTSNE